MVERHFRGTKYTFWCYAADKIDMQESNFCKQKKSEFFGKKYEKIEKMQISLKKFR